MELNHDLNTPGQQILVILADRGDVVVNHARSIVAATTFTASPRALLITRFLLHPQPAFIGRVLPTIYSQLYLHSPTHTSHCDSQSFDPGLLRFARLTRDIIVRGLEDQIMQLSKAAVRVVGLFTAVV